MAFPLPGESSRVDANQHFSLTVVQGTQGTATPSTTSTMPLTGDPITGALYTEILGTVTTQGGGTTPVSGTVTANINSGTQQTLGTVGNLNNGSVILQSGTLTTGTLQNLVSGTINALASGTITTGTISVTTGTVVGNIASNSVDSGNPVKTGGIYNGTQPTGTSGNRLDTQMDIRGNTMVYLATKLDTTNDAVNVGTITTGSLSNVALLNAGTITSVSNLVTGTIATVASITNLVSGTLLNSGTTTGVGVVTALTSGSVTLQSGTLTTGTLQNLVSGTINALASGTISTGTVAVTAGTLSPIPTIGQLTFGTFGTTGATVFGTLVGGTSSGAGTEIFVTSLSLTIPATGGSQDVSIGFGTSGGTFHSGTGRLVRGMFIAGGGIQKTFDPPINSGTNAQLCYFQAGAGTVEIDVTYFVTASTL